MLTISLRRQATGAAVLATLALVGGPVPSSQAAPAAARTAPTSLSIRVLDPRVEPDQTARINGHLAIVGPLARAGRSVTLEAKPLGSAEFVPVAETLTRARGGLSVDVLPQVTTRYRWHYAGDADTREAYSGIGAVRVKDEVGNPHRLTTSLAVRAITRPTDDGILDLVRGQLRVQNLPLRHRPVVLLSRTAADADWAFEGVELTRRHGTVRFPVDPAADTAYRLVFLGTTRLLPARSAVVRVPPRPDVSIAADPTTVSAGETTTLSGVVTFGGAALPGATVSLIGVRAPRPASAKVLATATTAEDGSVTFTDTPPRTTRYRFRVAPAGGRAGTLSAVVTVEVAPAPAG